MLPANAPAGLCPNCLMALNLQTETAFTDEKAAAQAPLPPEQIAPHFPQLEILECLGRGGMGVVYKARQKTLNRLVALKLLAPERVQDSKFAERFAREAQALAALNHPNIVTIHDFGQAGGFYYLLMEYVDGANLRQLLQARKFTPEEALAIVPSLCDALQFAHDRGIVHRDIKPENLLLDRAGRIKVADFGVAKMLGTGQETDKGGSPAGAEALTQSIAGTPGYSAPEQFTDPQKVDSRADIYSLGVVFYEMLTGELPGKRIEPPSRKVHMDVRLDEVVLRALEKEPSLRYQQASVLKTQVETIVATPEVTKEPAPRPGAGGGSPPQKSTGPSAFRRAFKIGLIVFAIVVSLAILVTLLLPNLYASTARVELNRAFPPGQNKQGTDNSKLAEPPYDPYFIQTEIEVIRSDAVLNRVVAELDLNQAWGKLSNNGQALKAQDTLNALKARLSLNSIPNTRVIAITCYSDSAAESAALANAVAGSYQDFTIERWQFSQTNQPTGNPVVAPELPQVLILERAVTPRSPSKPNKPLNIMVGTLLGLALGTLTFLPVFLVGLYRSMKTERAQSATGTSSSRLTGQKPDRFWRWVVVTVLALIAIPIVIAILGLLAAIAIPNFIKARQNAQQLGAQQLTQQGWQLWQDQKYPGALADFQKAVDLNPNQTNAWNGLGWAQFNSGEPHGAEQSFQKVIALDPKHPGALNGLGQIYLSQRKYYDAERYLLQAAPQAPAAWFGLARLYLLQGKFDQAETWAQKVVDSGQGDEIAAKMLSAAKEKHLSDGLRPLIEPPIQNQSPQIPPSTEMWSPNNGPGEKIDLQKILTDATDFMKRGEYEESLERHIWYFNHAIEQDPSQTGVRITSALSDWVELGRRYPKARAALIEIRDQDVNRLTNGAGYSDLFVDVLYINRELQVEDSTYAVFKTIREKDPQLAQQCWLWAESFWVAKGEYQWCYDQMGSSQSSFDSIRQTHENEISMRERMRESQERLAEIYKKNGMTNLPSSFDNSKMMADRDEKSFTGGVRQLVEILVGSGHKAEAEKIQEEALAIMNVPELQSAVADAELKVKAFKSASPTP